jgi:Bacteriophage lambda head decoration protein D
MSTVLTESTYLNDLLKWEMENYHSREQVTVLAGQDLIMGSVIGKIKVGAVPTTGTSGTNTGAVTCTGVTGGNKTKVGVYTLRCVTVVASGGVFSVKDPDGEALPEANVAVAYTNPAINFLLNDVGADAALGDTFTITVPVGSGKVKELNLAGIDGSEDAFGILIAGAGTTVTQKQVAYTSGGVAELLAGETLTGATSAATAQVVSFTLTSGTFAAGTAAGVLVVDNQVGTFQSENLNSANQADICTIGADTAVYYPDREAVAIVRDAQIVADYLTWPTGASVAQKAAALVQLRNNGIVERTDA